MRELALSWDQARNMLMAGMCNVVRYAPNQGACNSFIVHDGCICRVYDYNGEIEEAEPTSTRKTFVVMGVIMQRKYLTWAEAKNRLLTGMCKRVRYEPGCGVYKFLHM